MERKKQNQQQAEEDELRQQQQQWGNNNEAARRSNEVENSLSKQKHVGHAGQEASRRSREREGAVWRLWGNRILLRCRVCLPLPLQSLFPSRLMLLTHNLPLYECVNHASFSTAVALSNEVGHSSNPNPSPPSTRVKWFGLAWQICNTIYHTAAPTGTTTTKATRCVKRFKFDLQMMLNPFGFFFYFFGKLFL